MRVALLIAACLAALCPPASGQTVFSRPYEPDQIAVENTRLPPGLGAEGGETGRDQEGDAHERGRAGQRTGT